MRVIRFDKHSQRNRSLSLEQELDPQGKSYLGKNSSYRFSEILLLLCGDVISSADEAS